MKRFLFRLGMATLLLLNGPVFAHDHEHSHDSGGPAALSLNNGMKWSTDESLRQGMIGIRDALALDMPAIRAGSISTARLGTLADKVNAAIGSIFQNCKLEPKADAMLHLVLAEIMAGADVLTKATSPEAGNEGANRVAKALDNYQTYFEHPGWAGLK